MSSITLKSGFFDSRDNDRVYGANDFNNIFDGIINDGVVMSYGEQFSVIKNSSWTVTIKTGKAWFNNTWIINEVNQNVQLDTSQAIATTQKRKDVIAIVVDKTSNGRQTTIVNINGTLSTSDNPSAPNMPSQTGIYYHPIAYVTVNYEGIQKIENLVNTATCPLITSIIETTSLDTLLNSWRTDLDLFISARQNDFDTWFDSIQDLLTEDQATNLASEILSIQNRLNTLGSVINKTLTTSWVGNSEPYSQDITISGILSTDSPIIDMVPDSVYDTAKEQEKAWSNIYRAVCSSNKITFYAHEKPEVAIPIKIALLRC